MVVQGWLQIHRTMGHKRGKIFPQTPVLNCLTAKNCVNKFYNGIIDLRNDRR